MGVMGERGGGGGGGSRENGVVGKRRKVPKANERGDKDVQLCLSTLIFSLWCCT